MSETRLNTRQRRWITLAGVVVVVLLLVIAANVVLVFFCGVLLALFLSAVTDWVKRESGLSRGWSLTVVIVGILAVCGLTAWLLGGRISEQVQRLAHQLPEAVEHLRKEAKELPFGEKAIPSYHDMQSHIPAALSKAPGVLSSTFGVLAQIVVVLFVGFYLAAEPSRYVGSVVRLVPPLERARAHEVLKVAGHTLQRWIVGRLALMALNAVISSLALWLLGVPMAVALGILAGLLNFVPNLGPIIATVPAMLFAFLKGPWTALYVVVFYFVYQMVDGYVLTPLVQRRTVQLPPALTIMAQVLLGIMWGALGVLLAVPLTATAVVFTKMLYLEDTLGEEVCLPGDK